MYMSYMCICMYVCMCVSQDSMVEQFNAECFTLYKYIRNNKNPDRFPWRQHVETVEKIWGVTTFFFQECISLFWESL